MLQQLKTECLGKLAAITKSPQYPNLLKQLVIQGLIKIQEQTVEIQCRVEDRQILQRVVSKSCQYG
jgi:vacuolar-type H+-ATPase subunit E/Vma4